MAKTEEERKAAARQFLRDHFDTSTGNRNMAAGLGLKSTDAIPVHGHRGPSRAAGRRPPQFGNGLEWSPPKIKLPGNKVDPNRTHIILDTNIPIGAYGEPSDTLYLSVVDTIINSPQLQFCINTALLHEWYLIMELSRPKIDSPRVLKDQTITPEGKRKILDLISQAGAIRTYVSDEQTPEVEEDPEDNKLFVAHRAIIALGSTYIVSADRHVTYTAETNTLNPHQFLTKFK